MLLVVSMYYDRLYLDCCFLFFFKQKTAYDMRISDWSSDVCSSDLSSVFVHGYENAGDLLIATLLNLKDPYGGMMQSRDLREIASFQDPIYRAKSDLLELNLDADLGENLTVSSQTAWNWDGVYSFQDYNRYRSEEQTSELQSLMRISYAVLCLTKKTQAVH